MDRRLTPGILRRTLALPVADRVALAAALQDSLREPTECSATLQHLTDTMREVAGVDIREKTRRREVAWARNIFALVAWRHGISQSEIARYTGRDHSSVCLAIKRVEDAFAYPATYAAEIELYNKFVKRI